MLTLQDYNNFHRIDIHRELLKSAFEQPGEGPACLLKVNHRAVDIDADEGIIKFENGSQTSADLIVAADGIRVCVSDTINDWASLHKKNCPIVANLMFKVSNERTHRNHTGLHDVNLLLLPMHYWSRQASVIGA